MSTRCLTRVFNGEAEVACLYRHHDGYPEGHGKELTDFVFTLRLVNGYSSSATVPKALMANGAERMASKIVCFFERNEMAIYPVGAKDVWEDYEYHVMCPERGTKLGPNGVPCSVVGYKVLREGDTRKLVPIAEYETGMVGQ